MKYTINDIARISGYAKSTVSAALNRQAGVGDVARKKILRIAQELNYTPNELAKSISSQSYHTIGVIVRDIANPFYAKVCRAIEGVMEQGGYSIFIYNTDGRADRLYNAVRTMAGKRAAGMILDLGREDIELQGYLTDNAIAHVIFGVESSVADSVEADDREGAAEAAAYLADCGHRSVLYVGPTEKNVYSKRRLAGIREVLSARGVQLDTLSYQLERATVETGYHACGDILKRKEKPSAMIAFNDLIAVGIIRRLNENGIRVPEDISIVGFDDLDTVAFPLDTVSIPEYEMGVSAANLLLQRIANRDAELQHIKLQTKLMRRASVKRL